MIDKKSNLLISPESPSSTTSVYCAPPLKSLNVETPVSLICHLDINIYIWNTKSLCIRHLITVILVIKRTFNSTQKPLL